MADKAQLRHLPSVDEVLKSARGLGWLAAFPRRYVLDAVRAEIESRRRLIASGKKAGVTLDEMAPEIERRLRALHGLSLIPVINATGIVMHTNLGRSPLPASVLDNVMAVARGYSTLEYELEAGGRGERHSHVRRLLREVTGAQDGVIVNNNAAAVLICLNTLAQGREVIVSRGELVEIGGSFRIPDVMSASGAKLVEVGTTNKTHRRDYEAAINENTALLLKVHRSNFRMDGFVAEVSVEELTEIGRRHNLPVMFDLGSGCLIDLKPFGIHSEPSVAEVLRSGVDIVTISGDKLLGGPQAGIILGGETYVSAVRRNPLMRALRIDKLTLAALEATLREYIDTEGVVERIPTLRMLLESAELVHARAKKLASYLKGLDGVRVVECVAYSGGGALPMLDIKSYAVSIALKGMSVNKIEERLRLGEPHVIARIKDDALVLDARTIQPEELRPLADAVMKAMEL